MNSLFSRSLIIATILSFSHALLAHVELDYPVGGETLTAGTTVTITWHVAIAHNTLNWDLYYSPDGGANWEPIELGIPPAQLSYPWLVPSTATTHGRVRVFQNNTAQDYLDISGDFSIVLPSLLPTISLPAHDTTIQSDVINQDAAIQVWLTHHGGASVNSLCTNLTWTHNFDGLSNGCGSTGDALVTFTATDQCGSTQTTAHLTIVDNVNPTLSAPAVHQVVECTGSLSDLTAWLISHGGAHAFDQGGNVTWSNNYTALSNGCGNTGNATVTFTATDQCGNSISTTANFAIEDNTKPDLTAVAHDSTIECGTPNAAILIQQWLNHHGGASATDACGNVVWTNNFLSLSNDCGFTGHSTVTFIVSDECGNTSTTSAVIRVADTIPPVINAGANDTTIVCGLPDQQTILQKWLDHHAGAIATDQCGNINWTHDVVILPDTCGDQVIRFVRFTAIDDCGNSSETSATFTVQKKSSTSTSNITASDFELFPNPVRDQLTFRFISAEYPPVQLVLFDAHGKAVWNKNDVAQEILIPVNTYTSGIYFLRMTTTDDVRIRKVIIE